MCWFMFIFMRMKYLGISFNLKKKVNLSISRILTKK